MICTYHKKQIEEERKRLIKRLFDLETHECHMGPEGCEEENVEKLLQQK